MMKYFRFQYEVSTLYFALVTFNRRPFITIGLARVCPRVAWKKVHRNHPFDVLASILLPDHRHVVIRLPQNTYNFGLSNGI
jgi:putative transposase